MAKPIEGIPVFRDEAAAWLARYLKMAKPDPKKEEQAREDRKTLERIELVKK